MTDERATLTSRPACALSASERGGPDRRASYPKVLMVEYPTVAAAVPRRPRRPPPRTPTSIHP